MIAFQNPWIKPLIYFLSISTATMGLFWPEIIQASISAGQDPYTGHKLSEQAAQNITGLVLKNQRNNAEELSVVETVHTSTGVGADTRITLRLENSGRSGANDWPIVNVVYRDAGERGVRLEALAPAMYTHSGTLARSQTVEFTITPRAGELSAMFVPSYPKSAAP